MRRWVLLAAGLALALAIAALAAAQQGGERSNVWYGTLVREGNAVKVIRGDTGEVVGRAVIHRAIPISVKKVSSVPRVPWPENAEPCEMKLVSNNTVMVACKASNRTFYARIARRIPPAVKVERGPEPAITKAVISASGQLESGERDEYGPYAGTLAIEFRVGWSPVSLVCVGLLYTDTNSGPCACTYGTVIATQFPTDTDREYYAAILNVGPATITYSGTLTLYVW
jgi:hypothetical protein